MMRKRCKYQVRYFYSKGAFLVLLWTLLFSAAVWSYVDLQMLVPRIIIEDIDLDIWKTVSQVFTALPFLAYIIIPIIGWLADAKHGNYRVFKFSCFFLLVALITVCINILCAHKINSIALQYISSVIIALVYVVGIASIAVCIMTALQLGLDQMPDSSSTNV